MKSREIYSELKVIPPIVVRIDGRNFKNTLQRLQFKKPYSIKFAKAMADSIELFFRDSGLNPILGYTFSDEINLLFFELPFKGRVEKLDSIIPSFFSSALTILLDLKIPISFDARVILLNKDNIIEYLIWRQAEAWRNHVNSYGFYTLLEKGLSEKEASLKLKGMKSSEIHEMLFNLNINLAKTPTWQRRGILVYKESYEKIGFDPIKKVECIAKRARVVQNWEIPLFNSIEGIDFLGIRY